MWNHLEMLIEVVWVPCIEVEGTSRGHTRYLAHLVHLLPADDGDDGGGNGDGNDDDVNGAGGGDDDGGGDESTTW